jgi:recombination protein RecA
MAKTKKPAKQPTTLHGLSVEDTAKLQAVLAGLKKNHGDDCIGTLTDVPDMTRFGKQISSGSVGLDMAIGPMYRRPDGSWNTGLPGGIGVEIFGPESSGKTSLTLHLIASAQAQKGVCGFLDMEHALDPLWAVALGVKMEDLYWSQPSSGDQCLQMAAAMFQSNVFDVIVVDSVAALVPQGEIDGEVGDSHVGMQARLMSQFFRMVGPSLGRKSKTTLIFINQIREKIGVKFGSPETTPGGRALKFYSSIRLDIRRIGNVKEGGDSSEDEAGTIVGIRNRVKCIKNKLAPPFRVAEYSFYFGKGINQLEELIDIGEKFGVIKKSGSWYYLGDQTFQGKANLFTHIASTKGLPYQLYNALLTAHVAQLGYTPDGVAIPGFLQPTLSHHAQFEPPTEQELKEAAEGESEDVPPFGVPPQ